MMLLKVEKKIVVSWPLWELNTIPSSLYMLRIHSQIAEHISNAMGKVNSLKCNIWKAKKINNKVSQTIQLSNK